MFKTEVILASQAPAALSETYAQRNEGWDVLAEQLQDLKRGDWLRLTFDQLPGKTQESKRHILAKSLTLRKLFIITRILGAHLYVRIRTAQDPKRKTK